MKQTVRTNHAPEAVGPYSQAIKVDGFVFLSGQIPLDPAAGQIVPGGISEQTEQVLKNIASVLQAAGTDLSRVVKTTVFLKNMAELTAMNQVYSRFFKADPPSRSTVEVVRLPKDALIEIEVIALS
jgi:2-iminobutanoate/2-iminopropanoate deaminase